LQAYFGSENDDFLEIYFFNPLDKVVELYEHLVLAEKEKIEYLEKLLKGK